MGSNPVGRTNVFNDLSGAKFWDADKKYQIGIRVLSRILSASAIVPRKVNIKVDWTCPHCGALQTATESSHSDKSLLLAIGEFAEGVAITQNPLLAVDIFAFRCASAECRKVTVAASMSIGAYDRRLHDTKPLPNTAFFSGRIYPKSSGKIFSTDIPERFRQDCQEAWAIIEFSPKSSATLARRCLQGMIRDFCDIKGRTLWDEINTLEMRLTDGQLPRGVDQDTIEAMRAVKDIGNIGAHMTEVDGRIVDVDPNEAEILLDLIEMLFADWYVARAKRERMLSNVVAIKAAKQSGKI